MALRNHVHPKAQPQYDRGPVDAGFGRDGLSLVLAPSADRQATLDAYLVALDAYLAAFQDPSSPDYRNWLTPEQFAARYRVSVSAWTKSPDGLPGDRECHGANHSRDCYDAGYRHGNLQFDQQDGDLHSNSGGAAGVSLNRRK